MPGFNTRVANVPSTLAHDLCTATASVLTAFGGDGSLSPETASVPIFEKRQLPRCPTSQFKCVSEAEADAALDIAGRGDAIGRNPITTALSQSANYFLGPRATKQADVAFGLEQGVFGSHSHLFRDRATFWRHAGSLPAFKNPNCAPTSVTGQARSIREIGDQDDKVS